MAGIYIHIPFCKQKCHYCNFFSVASARHRKEFIPVLLKEIELQKDYLEGEAIETIYLGGGTPSLLNKDELLKIFSQVSRFYKVADKAEITLEANPDDITEDKIRELKNTPINRLSIGIQSFFDDDLRYLNRIHDSLQARKALDDAKKAGFDNLTIDLIYGIPTLNDEKWIHNLDFFFSLNIPHLSAYALTVETKTPLHHLIEKKKMAPLDEVQSVGHFKILLEKARENGFIHYEISNFCREGYYSKHNSLYWLGGYYLGLGPSAHSFNGYSRQWNVSGIGNYLELVNYQQVRVEREILTMDQRYNEYVMTSLRTIWGCDTIHIENVFGRQKKYQFTGAASKYLLNGWLRNEGSRYFLTDEGKLFADRIASDLFAEE
jgi:oxygen-independent coproporphyrinogen-3 oxidase